MDKISIQGLLVNSKIGIFSWEKQIEQPLEIDLTYRCDARYIAQEDDINQAIDYAAISHTIKQFTQENRFQLLETLAEKLADTLLQQFDLAWIQLTIKKIAAIKGAKYVAIDLERERKR